MKTITTVLMLVLTAWDLEAQTTPATRPATNSMERRLPATGTNSGSAALPGASKRPQQAFPAAPPVASPANPAPPIPAGPPAATGNAPSAPRGNASQEPEEMIPAGNINFQGVDVNQVLEVYAKLVGRTLLRAGLPAASIVLKTETPLTKSEAIEALQTVLALNGISVVNIGDKFVKVMPAEQAGTAGAAFNDAPAGQLPDLGAYVTHIVQLKYVKPSEMVPILQPFAKLPNSIVPIDGNGILVLRDNAENVKRMLQMIERVDVSVPAVYISEVIPIKYALADDIASALNSLGGTGGSTVAIGGSTSGGGTRGGSGTVSGLSGQQRPAGFGNTGVSGMGTTTPNGTPSGSGSTFQQRLQSIIQRAAGSGGGGQQEPIQIFGQTKIIADERSNSLLIFATKDDMERIKAIIDKLDVLLSQVLIESVIMEVSLGKGVSTAVSAVQNPSAISSSKFAGGGGYNNGPTFLSFLSNNVANVSSNGATSFGNAIMSGGLSYFGTLFGTDYQLAIQAAANDSSTTIIQKPRIQTFQAQKATFFVGQTVPYVTGSTYGSAYGNSSSYSQLSVGVELDVTPFINPEGLVVMEINEEIDDISGSTPIQGVGNVPNTDKRTLTSNVAVKDGDAVILGGAIRSEKDKSSSGVPILQDIPLLGALFSAKTSNKTRQELLVLIRPTVLRTPAEAALQAKKEEARLPGIAHAESQDNAEQAREIQAEERADRAEAAKQAKAEARAKARGEIPSGQPDTNAVPVR